MIVIKMLPPPEANSPNSGHQLLLIVPLEHRRKELGARHLRDQHGQQGQHDQDGQHDQHGQHGQQGQHGQHGQLQNRGISDGE